MFVLITCVKTFIHFGAKVNLHHGNKIVALFSKKRTGVNIPEIEGSCTNCYIKWAFRNILITLNISLTLQRPQKRKCNTGILAAYCCSIFKVQFTLEGNNVSHALNRQVFTVSMLTSFLTLKQIALSYFNNWRFNIKVFLKIALCHVLTLNNVCTKQ